MRRVAVAVCVLLVLTGCVSGFGMGPVEAKTDRIADELEKLDGVVSVDRQFTDKGFMQPHENSDVVVYVESDPELDDLVGIVERFRELDWQGDPESELSIYADNPGHSAHTFSVTNLDDDLIKNEARLWINLVSLMQVVFLSYEETGERSVRTFIDEDSTLTSTVSLLRDLSELDHADLPTDWSLLQYVEGEGQPGSFDGDTLPSEEQLDAILAADAVFAAVGRPVVKFGIDNGDTLLLRLHSETPEIEGMTETAAALAIPDTATGAAAVEAVQALDATGLRVSLVLSTNVVITYARVEFCGGEPDLEDVLSPVLQKGVSGANCG